jgi:hypothetical protein
MTTTMSNNMNWRRKTKLKDDYCSIDVQERQSMDPHDYQTNNFFRQCNEPILSSKMVNQTMTNVKVYGNTHQCEVDDDSDLRYASLTNLHNIQQLFTRPYAGSFHGAGQSSGAHLKDVESSLMQSQYNPSFKSIENTQEHYIDRFDYLPQTGYPQKVEHIVPVWTRGGVLSRELVRSISYPDYAKMIRQKPY